MIPGPGCYGTGVNGQLHGPGPREYAMVQVYSLEQATHYVKCRVTDFKPSGIKAVNDGDFTFEWPDGRTETREVGYGGSNGLYKVCPQCDGAREIEEDPRDMRIINEGQDFLVSGKGTLRAAMLESNGLWVAFRRPTLSLNDLLTDHIGRVYRIREYPRWSGLVKDDGRNIYQTFWLQLIGEAKEAEGEAPKECETHGWYCEATCPECEE
jgi:hypothetical protein